MLIIIEDNCFIGLRCIVVEGVRVGKELVLGVNVVLIKFIRIIDVMGEEVVIYCGEVFFWLVVILGIYMKFFFVGDY